MKLTFTLGLAAASFAIAQDSAGGFTSACNAYLVEPPMPGDFNVNYGRLTAHCGPDFHESFLDLNKCLGNENGNLVWRQKWVPCIVPVAQIY